MMRLFWSSSGKIEEEKEKNGDLDFFINHYWDDEPDIPRIATGIGHRVDRLKCLGNAVVPQQFYPIFKVIADLNSQEALLDRLRGKSVADTVN